MTASLCRIISQNGYDEVMLADTQAVRREGQKTVLLHRLQQPIQILPNDLRVRMLVA